MRLCIVDDHEVVREGLRVALGDSQVDVVGSAGSGSDALSLLRRTLPDVVLLDFRLPDMTGDVLCRRIRADFPSTGVVILTTYLSEDIVQRCLDAGASAFVTKAAGLAELRRVLDDLASGVESVHSSATTAIVRRLHEATADPTQTVKVLTPQQERVLELAAAGCTYGEIGRRLFVTESTVRFHVQGLKSRLGVKTKAELIAVAVRDALIHPSPDAGTR